LNVAAEVAAAHLSANRAESAYADGDFATAEALHEEAERRHTKILRAICELTDAEADAVEPAFSELEKRLFRLRSGASCWISVRATAPGFDNGGTGR
jgi:hypothetical protein